MKTTPVKTDPSRILDIATGYMAAQQLFAASRIGLFRAISEGAASSEDIASTCNVTPRMARILADTMASLDLLTRANAQYALTDAARTYLLGEASELDLAPFLTFLREISYPHWLQFTQTVDTDQPGDLGMNEARWGTFLGGVMTYNRLHADMFANAMDFSEHKHALDLGGLAPYFAIRAMQSNTDLKTTFAYAPDFADRIPEQLAEAGVSERSQVVGMPTATARPQGEHDLVFVNHVIHRFSAEENQQIFKNARAASVEGARLTVLDFFLDDEPKQRAIDALHAGEYLVIDGTVVFPESEVRQWLEGSGWRPIETIALPGCPRVLVAEAV
tara:strand:- start:78870 stop:79862 length:993 start_codon:yes stop_codon:yes gene_type:complete